MRTILPLLFSTLMLGACGVYGPKGNDTGGIIPWSSANEQIAMMLAQENCSYYKKYAVIRSIRPIYGDFIAYECRFEPAESVREIAVISTRG